MDLSEEALWRGVLDRDPRYDGVCFYGVMSTGVYCRFHCTSRRPLRKNTRFFFSREGAEKAGFRPCKRCRPDGGGTSAVDKSAAMVVAVCRYIESCETIPTLAELSRYVRLSTFHLQREFKKALGITPRNYADAHRQLRFKRGTENG